MDQAKKRTYPSAAQKVRLIALVEADEELRRGKFSSRFTKKEGERRWGVIAEELNSIPGSKREWKEWRKTWQDMKAAAKKKSAACRFSAASTGGGPPAAPMSEESIAVLRTISSSALFGHADSNESVVHFEDLLLDAHAVVEVEVLDCEDHSKPPPAANPPAAATGIAVELHDDVPGTSKPSNVCMDSDPRNTQTGDVHIECQQCPETSDKEDKAGSSADKEKRPCTIGKNNPKRRAAVRRLEQGLAVSGQIRDSIEKKYNLKKKFYEDLINEMRAQTEILKDISQKLSRFD